MKKGVVFTFITVLLLFVIITAFLINLNSRKNNMQLTQIKIDNSNLFFKNLNSTLIPEAIK